MPDWAPRAAAHTKFFMLEINVWGALVSCKNAKRKKRASMGDGGREQEIWLWTKMNKLNDNK